MIRLVGALVVLNVGTLIAAVCFGAQVYADRDLALLRQSDHLEKVFAVPGNVSVCQDFERFVAVVDGSLQAQRTNAENDLHARATAFRKNELVRLKAVTKSIKEIEGLHCQDIRTLTFDLQDPPVPAITIRDRQSS